MLGSRRNVPDVDVNDVRNIHKEKLGSSECGVCVCVCVRNCKCVRVWLAGACVCVGVCYVHKLTEGEAWIKKVFFAFVCVCARFGVPMCLRGYATQKNHFINNTKKVKIERHTKVNYIKYVQANIYFSLLQVQFAWPHTRVRSSYWCGHFSSRFNS